MRAEFLRNTRFYPGSFQPCFQHPGVFHTFEGRDRDERKPRVCQTRVNIRCRWWCQLGVANQANNRVIPILMGAIWALFHGDNCQVLNMTVARLNSIPEVTSEFCTFDRSDAILVVRLFGAAAIV